MFAGDSAAPVSLKMAITRPLVSFPPVARPDAGGDGLAVVRPGLSLVAPLPASVF